ncbi:hypothetical protein [Coxiella burnetii]|nr:hypothetical protein [Coxiella burnetii]ACJ17876.1 hypothetical protein CbuG_0450 [Coxiella burnetii CbuG_Q212]ATN66302.1 hypothetical protein AYM17_02105 [Coxiella burnetii]OYK86748.1 hypothetical protein CbuQ229_02240 [Coxiella burnetii]
MQPSPDMLSLPAKTKTQEKINKNQKVNPLPENQIRSYLPAF